MSERPGEADFSDRTVVVTGAAGNLGHAVGIAFAKLGANLVLVGLHAESLAERFGSDNDRQLLVAADLRMQSQASAVTNAAIARFRRIDVLCNIAGGFRMGEAVHEMSDETWEFLFDLNVRSLLNMVRATVPRMIELGGGRIVNIGAHAALKGGANMGAYCASKAAVIRLTESMAAELRDKGINVNCVLPTTIDTPQNRKAMPDADPSRWVAPEDLASTIVFLASPAARALHGAAIPVTGLS
jgi:NAD(P)-dependent dehydrogenase (short-subunit alcohol dehydrogenase family)